MSHDVGAGCGKLWAALFRKWVETFSHRLAGMRGTRDRLLDINRPPANFRIAERSENSDSLRSTTPFFQRSCKKPKLTMSNDTVSFASS